MMRSWQNNRFIAGCIFFISLAIYLKTSAPTTSFWDCGEFITCSYILGVPHPPGAPLYLLIGRLFTMLPVAADIGFRVNLISVIFSALTVMLTYLIIVQLIKLWRGNIQSASDRLISYGAGIIGALALLFSDSVWFNAVEAEVYGLSLFFTSTVCWLILAWQEKADAPHSDRYILLIAYFIGLTIGVHLLIVLALPAVFLIFYFRRYAYSHGSFALFSLISFAIMILIYPGIVKWFPSLSLFLTPWSLLLLPVLLFVCIIYALKKSYKNTFLVLSSFLLIIIGASTYGSIYTRSNLDPVIDENNPESIENFISYLNRDQYGSWSITERRAPLWSFQIKEMYLQYFSWQFIGKSKHNINDSNQLNQSYVPSLLGLPLALGIFGLFHHFRKDRKRAFAILLLFLMTGLAIVLYLNQTDPQPRQRDYVFVGSFFAFSIWIGIGAAGILEFINDKFRNKALFSSDFLSWMALFVIFLLVPVNMLANNYHTHDRSGNYAASDYAYNILQSCEKDAIVFTNGDNDTFPLWFLQYVKGIRQDVRVVNLSLLNAPWYIKQLKYQQPEVPISFSDSEIDNLSLKLWPEKKNITINVSPDIFQSDLEDLGDRKSLIIPKEKPEISFELGPTYYGRALRIQDLMVLNIIFTNKFRRPTYFAVTVSPENMLNVDDYLRMDGLCYKFVTYPGGLIAPSKLKRNLTEVFKYRNLNNPDVYYDETELGLFTNYRTAFLRLAEFYSQEKMQDEMNEVLTKMNRVLPGKAAQ